MVEQSKNEPLDWPFFAEDESAAWRSTELTYAERMEIISAFAIANMFFLNHQERFK